MFLANLNERQRDESGLGHLEAFDMEDGIVSSRITSCTGGERKGEGCNESELLTAAVSGLPWCCYSCMQHVVSLPTVAVLWLINTCFKVCHFCFRP